MNLLKTAPLLSRTSAARPQWLLVVAGVALLAVCLWVVSAVAVVAPSVGGGDAGVQQAAVSGAARAASESATDQGIVITITGLVADDTRTVIGLAVEGREDLGDTVFPLGRRILTDQDGRAYSEIGGSADQDNRRHLTIMFPPLDPAASSISLTLTELEILKHADAVAATGAGVPSSRVNGKWELHVNTGGVFKSPEVAVDAAARTLGLGSIVIDRVQQSPSGTVISGHLSGFSMDEIPEMLLSGTLVVQSGSGVAMTGLHMGYGPNRELFELRFPRTTGAVTVQLTGSVTSQPHDVTPAASLGSKLGGNPAEWSVTLPD